MVDTRISGLTAGSAVADADIIPAVETAGIGPVKKTALQLKTYVSNSPTLVTPALGTPASGTLTNCTGLPVGGIASIAATSFVANSTGAGASPSAVSAATATSILSAMVGDSGAGGTKGLVPAPGAGDSAAGKFLNAGGTWTVPAGGGGSPGGSGTEVQYRAGVSTFGAMSGSAWDNTNQALSLTSTGGGTGITTSNPILNLAQTWNAGAVTFTGLKFNVTSTASSASSLLVDLQTGGASQFSVRKDGVVTASNSFTTTALNVGMLSAGIFVGNTANFGFSSGSSVFAATDVYLSRAAAASLQIGAADVSSGAVAQTLTVQSNTGAATTGPDFSIVGSGGLTTGGNILIQTKATTTGATQLKITPSGGVLAVNATGGIGYGTGAGGTVTQATSRTTGVTLNKVSGQITMFTAAGSATPATFTVTNSAVAATDVVVLSIASGATNTYNLSASSVSAGSFVITFYTSGGTASDTPVINFAVIKAVAA